MPCFECGEGRAKNITCGQRLPPAIAETMEICVEISCCSATSWSLRQGKECLNALLRTLCPTLARQAAKIVTLAENLEEFHSEKNLSLASLAYTEEDAAAKLLKDIAAMEERLE